MITSCSTELFVILYYLIFILEYQSFIQEDTFKIKQSAIPTIKDHITSSILNKEAIRTTSDLGGGGGGALKVQLIWPEQL